MSDKWISVLLIMPTITQSIFLLNSVSSLTRNCIYIQEIIRTCNLLYKKPRYDHSTSKTWITDMIFEISPVHASVIYQIPWIHCISVPFRKNSNELQFSLGWPQNVRITFIHNDFKLSSWIDFDISLSLICLERKLYEFFLSHYVQK